MREWRGRDPGAAGRRRRGEPADARRGVAGRARRAVVPGDGAGAGRDPAQRRGRRLGPVDRLPPARRDGPDVRPARRGRRLPHRHRARPARTTSSSAPCSITSCTTAGSPTPRRRRRSSTSCSTGSGSASRARSGQCGDASRRRPRGPRRRGDPRLVLHARERAVRAPDGLRPVRHPHRRGRGDRAPDGVQPGLLQPVPRDRHPRRPGAGRRRAGRRRTRGRACSPAHAWSAQARCCWRRTGGSSSPRRSRRCRR